MKDARTSVSPRQVAVALGVSESSVKRWSDQGLMATRKTAGGHRKLVLADVLRFVREQGFAVGKPELLGLPGSAPRKPLAMDDARAALLVATIAGDGPEVRRIIIGLFMGGVPLTTVFDAVVGPALHGLGDAWEHGKARVFEEHRAILLIEAVLHELRALMPRATRRKRPAAVVAGLSRDPYTIAIRMAELTIAELGWATSNLGPDTPAHALCEAIVAIRPRVLGLGIHAVADPVGFVDSYALVAACARAHRTALVIGGPAATPELRAQIRYAACCANMRELADFCTSLAS